LSEFPCRIYLSAPVGHPIDVLSKMLGDALANNDVAAILYTTENGVSRENASALMQCAINHDAAFLVADDIDFAREIGADGVHISGGIEAYKKARSELGDDRIVGMTTALNRHDSMSVGEMGTDYIFFDPDIPESPIANEKQSLEDIIDWWSGLFQLPCVTQVQRDINLNRAIINAGVDFLSLDHSLWVSKENATNTLQNISNLIAECGRTK